LIGALIAWVALAQPVLALASVSQHALGEDGPLGASGEAGAPCHVVATGDRGLGWASAPDSGRAGCLPEAVHVDHDCNHLCHAGAHLLALPICDVAIGLPDSGRHATRYGAGWRSQHLTPPDRPPRTIA